MLLLLFEYSIKILKRNEGLLDPMMKLKYKYIYMSWINSNRLYYDIMEGP